MKTCPQCGKEMADTVKFCVNCGYQFPVAAASQPAQPQPVQAAPQSAASQPQPGPAPQPTSGQAGPTAGQAGPTPNYQQQAAPGAPAAPNETLEKAKHASRNYWSWLIRSVAHPSDDTIGGNKFFGLASMVLIAIFNMLTLMIPAVSIANTAVGYVSGFEGTLNSFLQTNSTSASDYASHVAGTLIFRTGLGLLLLIFVCNLAFFFVSFFAQRMIAPIKFDCLTAMTEFGRYISLNVFLSAVTALVAIIGRGSSMFLSVPVIIISLVLELLAFYQLALSHGKKSGFDSQYKLLLISFLLAGCVFLPIVLMGALLGTIAAFS